MDPHQNIFYYYRNPSQNRDEQFVYDRQIENNTTKSLVNLLEKSSDPQIMSAFLNLLERESKFSLSKYSSAKDFRYRLQAVPHTFSGLEKRFTVFISNDPTISNETKGTIGGRPDAWIYSPSKSLVFMIEVKLDSPVYQCQIEGHLKKCGWETNTPIIKLRWAQIHTAFLRINGRLSNPLDKFLMDEFLKYMEVIGMADFNGFTGDDFDFFINYDREYKPTIRNKLVTFATRVHNSLPATIRNEYKDVHMGRILQTAWIGLRKDQKSRDIFKQCNFTFSMNRDELFINTVIRNGKYTDGKKPIGVLYQKIRDNRKAFQKLLQSFSNEDLSFIIFRRPERPRPGYDIWTKISDVSLEIVNEELVDYILSLLKKISFPGIHISRRISRGDKLLTNPDVLVKESRDSIVNMKKILDFLTA